LGFHGNGKKELQRQEKGKDRKNLENYIGLKIKQKSLKKSEEKAPESTVS